MNTNFKSLDFSFGSHKKISNSFKMKYSYLLEHQVLIYFQFYLEFFLILKMNNGPSGAPIKDVMHTYCLVIADYQNPNSFSTKI